MASSAPNLHKFLVYAPDKTDEGTFQKRLSVRDEHFAAVIPRITSGIVSASSMTLETLSALNGLGYLV